MDEREVGSAPDGPENGRARESGERWVLEVRSPADGRLIGEVDAALPVEVLQAVERARACQREWVEQPAEDRFGRLARLAEVIGDRAEALAEVIHAETGKPHLEALTEVLMSLELLRYYAEVAPRVLRRQWVKTGWLIGKSAYLYREPYGVVGLITPWNYPFLLPMDVIAAALYGGNAVVLKPSEFTPHSALAILDLCREAGLPDGLVAVVPGDWAAGDALAGAGADKLVFIGSPRAGRAVMAKAAEHLTPVSLELGGKDAAIVLDDADVERAAAGVVFGGFFNAGQSCLSIERVFVAAPVYDAFVQEVVALARRLRVGREGEYDVGPITTPRQLAVVEAQIEDAVQRGARVLTGGRREQEGSNLFLPTVLVDVDASMRVMWEETFGPVLPIVRVRDEDEAVRLVNVNPFGLAVSVWTEDRERGERVGERVRAGGVSVNDVLSHYAVAGLPVGGIGESGFGRRRGLAGLEEVTRTRSVLLHRTGLPRELWWFPYAAHGRRLAQALVGYRHETGLKRVWAGMLGLLQGGPR